MRIVAGKYGGRRLGVPKGRDIRPTSDKVRGAVFNALHSRGAVEGARVLDAFCGTGALGLEALSRGAAHCTFVDAARESLALARENAHMLGAENDAAFILKEAGKLPQANEACGLVFLDPPYNKDLIVPVLMHLAQAGWIAPGAVVVAEAEKGFTWPGAAGFEMMDERIYGETRIFYLRYSVNPK